MDYSKVPPWSTVKVLEWTLEYQDYQDQLVDQAAVMLTLSGRVEETQQVLATQFSFRLRTPDLLLKVGRTPAARRDQSSSDPPPLPPRSLWGKRWWVSGRRWRSPSPIRCLARWRL